MILKIKTIGDYKKLYSCFFDDMLDSNEKLIDPFFTRVRHKGLDVLYLAQSHFKLPKRNNSQKFE